MQANVIDVTIRFKILTANWLILIRQAYFFCSRYPAMMTCTGRVMGTAKFMAKTLAKKSWYIDLPDFPTTVIEREKIFEAGFLSRFAPRSYK